MHTAAMHLAPVLGAEKSKVPFYIAGGVLVAWAFFISMGVGMRRADFPSNLGQQRAVMAVTVVLVLAAVSMAVVTAGGSKTAAKAAALTTTGAESTAPAAGGETTPSSGGTSAPASTTPTTSSSSSSSSAAGASTSLKLEANPQGQLAFNTKSLAAKAGSVTITMTNMSQVEHNVTIAEGSNVLGQTPVFVGGSKTLTVNLKPGTYTFYCSVPGHRQAGMEGTLTVT